MNDQLKPTNDEIAEYILSWIKSFAGGRMITIHSDENTILKTMLITNDFQALRKMFNTRLYNSIQEYVKDTKGENNK